MNDESSNPNSTEPSFLKRMVRAFSANPTSSDEVAGDYDSALANENH